MSKQSKQDKKPEKILPPNHLENARDYLSKVISHLNIKQIIYVDDDFCKTSESFYDPAKVLAALMMLGDADVPDDFTQILGNNLEAYTPELVGNVLKGMNESKKREALQKIGYQLEASEVQEPGVAEDPPAVANFKSLFSGLIDYKLLSPEEWVAKEVELKDLEIPPLVLMDYDLSKSSIGRNGMDLIAASLQGGAEFEFALFTHTINEDAEERKLLELSLGSGIAKESFIVIAKQRINSPDKTEFLGRFRLALMKTSISEIKSELQNFINESAAETLSSIRELTVYDFDYIVFTTSYKDGLFETESMIRLTDIFMKENLQNRLAASGGLRELLTTARRLRSHEALSPLQPTRAIQELQRREYYLDAEYINQNHKPIDSGDIFEDTHTHEKYVLLIPQCDIAIRGDGERNVNPQEFLLLPIRKAIEWKVSRDKLPVMSQYYNMKYFEISSDQDYYVNFRDSKSIAARIIDLCAFDSQGIARYANLSQISQSLPDNISIFGQALYQSFERDMQQWEMEREAVSSQCDNPVIAKIMEKLLPLYGSDEKVTFLDGVLTYSYQRVGRLKNGHAADLLLKFSNFRSRLGFEGDFGAPKSFTELEKIAQT